MYTIDRYKLIMPRDTYKETKKLMRTCHEPQCCLPTASKIPDSKVKRLDSRDNKDRTASFLVAVNGAA